MRVTKIFDWHCAHRLPFHKGLCKNVHGHTYKLEIEVQGTVNDVGMVIDFGDLKALVKKEIVDKFDHALVVWDGDEPLKKLVTENGFKHLFLPYQTTAENMVTWIYQQLTAQKRLTDFAIVRVKLWETDTSYAEVGQ